jgi:hypothetical protein
LSYNNKMTPFYILYYISVIESGIMMTASLEILAGRINSGKTLKSGSKSFSMSRKLNIATSN